MASDFFTNIGHTLCRRGLICVDWSHLAVVCLHWRSFRRVLGQASSPCHLCLGNICFVHEINLILELYKRYMGDAAFNNLSINFLSHFRHHIHFKHIWDSIWSCFLYLTFCKMSLYFPPIWIACYCDEIFWVSYFLGDAHNIFFISLIYQRPQKGMEGWSFFQI